MHSYWNITDMLTSTPDARTQGKYRHIYSHSWSGHGRSEVSFLKKMCLNQSNEG